MMGKKLDDIFDTKTKTAQEEPFLIQIPHKIKDEGLVFVQVDTNNPDVTVFGIKYLPKDTVVGFAITYTLKGKIEEYSIKGILKLIDKQEHEIPELTMFDGIEEEFWKTKHPYSVGETFAASFNKELVSA